MKEGLVRFGATGVLSDGEGQQGDEDEDQDEDASMGADAAAEQLAEAPAAEGVDATADDASSASEQSVALL